MGRSRFMDDLIFNVCENEFPSLPLNLVLEGAARRDVINSSPTNPLNPLWYIICLVSSLISFISEKTFWEDCSPHLFNSVTVFLTASHITLFINNKDLIWLHTLGLGNREKRRGLLVSKWTFPYYTYFFVGVHELSLSCDCVNSVAQKTFSRSRSKILLYYELRRGV